MRPSARVQSAIELLDSIIAAARTQGAPADRILADWFRHHRFAGSKDRRAIRDLVYAAIRACGPVPETGRSAMIRLALIDPAIAALFDGSSHGPAPMEDGEVPANGGLAPQWLTASLERAGIKGEEAAALLERAPLDIRVNTLKADRRSLCLPEPAIPTLAPQGLRLVSGTPVERWDAYRNGIIEIQDTGSQLVSAAVTARPGETVLDLCAGGGGKTLALAADMEIRGRLIAADTDRARLQRLGPRAQRAGAGEVETRLLDPGREFDALADLAGQADAVLIDAPCSGTGTWRRNPEARWRLTPAELKRLVTLQARLLDLGTRFLRPGGRIVYATCSLLDEEGAEQFTAFLARHPQFRSTALAIGAGSPRGQGVRLTPYADDTDGFFIACAYLPC